MGDTILTVKLNIANAGTAAILRDAVSSIPGLRIQGNGASGSDIMILEIGHDLDREFSLIEQIKAGGHARNLCLTSSRKDTEVLLKALKAGVREFFPQPIKKEEVIAALAKIKGRTEAQAAEAAAEKNGAVIGVIGTTGGVGSTTTAVNLAVSLRQAASAKSVVLTDMTPLLGNMHLFLDIRSAFSWADAAKDINRMDSTYLYHTLYRHATGLYVLPAPLKATGLEGVTAGTMEQLLGFMRSAFDIIVIDGSKSLDERTLRMLALSDTLLIVSELNILSLVNGKKLIDTFEGLGIAQGNKMKIVINRYTKESLVSPSEAEKILGRPIAARIGNDYDTVLSAINAGKTLADLDGKSAVKEQFRELAALVLNKPEVRKENRALSRVIKNFRNLALHIHRGAGEEI